MPAILLPIDTAGIAAGELVAWLVEPGDSVEKGQLVAEVETDKRSSRFRRRTTASSRHCSCSSRVSRRRFS
ncbi:biotin/lipoyl-containing protein [Natrialba taiwanensis]|uniref:biotin/lipoyl-containing protein n=1 Tax=Natrialba taiwanensis TaxID=160846 RepID=UPI00373AE156